MTKSNYLAHTIEQTDSKPAYDAACKKFLACKPILAWIMKCCVKEFAVCSIEDIVEKYIEGEPAVCKCYSISEPFKAQTLTKK